MTNDFDELISAYIDGVTTPEETARVDADPELRAAADRLRALAGEVGRVPMPPPEVRSAHLSAALDAFDALGGSTDVLDDAAPEVDGFTGDADPGDTTGGGSGDGVVSLDRHRVERREAPPAGRPGGIPSWLGAAAAAVVVVGGLGLAFQQLGSSGGDDSFDAAIESADESAEDGDARATGAAAESAELDADDSAEDTMEAEESEAMADEEASDEAFDATEEDSASSAPSSTTTQGALTTTPGLFPQEVEERRVDLDGPPTPEVQQALLAENEPLSAALSVCGERFDLGEVVGFVPLTVAGAPAELLIYIDAAGAEALIAVDGTCLPF